MRLYIALILSAALHLAAVFLISEKVSPHTQVDLDRTILSVSIKDELVPAITGHFNVTSQTKIAKSQSPFATYLSEQDVETKAVPTSNIDQTRLNDVFISGLPIKMRLYINSEGHIVKIEKQKTLAQDKPLQESLAKIIFEISFLPAKKNGIAVNSYQDISFTFN